MSAIVCSKCGRITNTAVSEWIPPRDDGKAYGCFAAYVEGQWVKGCCYDQASIYDLPGIDSLLLNRPIHDAIIMDAEDETD